MTPLRFPAGTLSLDQVRVMGILNITSDSFFPEARHLNCDAAVARAIAMAGEGADIIDVGGEKAGPGEPVGVEEELRRVIPVIEAIRREIGLPISIDTLKPQVAEAAVEAGAGIINSVSGFADQAMRDVAARTAATIVIMHIQGKPRVANPNPAYGEVVVEVRDWLMARADLCIESGVARDRIVLDLGPAFGKRPEHDIALLRNLEAFTSLPFPILLAASRKPFIGDILGSSVENRLEGSLAVAACAVLKGVRIVRAHDVRQTVRVVRMTEAIMRPEEVEQRA